ncbi:MAG: indole-3-glycerol phosphate synthase TrpC [Candidatus Omnitrophica bacterium]|nr:indole-3-glycerol phosphate synthase TrpC [Candidatus Omnitrophota bacterium]
MILDKIIVHKKKELEEKKVRYPLSKIMNDLETVKDRRRLFKKALTSRQGINIIAEIKKASPSKGVIREDFDPMRLAQLYEFSEACALSVLTETHFFKGRLKFLRTVRQVTARPILRKDFIIDSYQLYETALMAADAVLLISSLLTTDEIQEYIQILKQYEIDALVEVHTENDLKKAIDGGAEIIGINNRNLYTFDVDIEVTQRLIRRVPKGMTIVSESGIKTYEDIQSLRSVGVHAFLIGEVLLKSPDIINTMHKLRGVPTI